MPGQEAREAQRRAVPLATETDRTEFMAHRLLRNAHSRRLIT